MSLQLDFDTHFAFTPEFAKRLKGTQEEAAEAIRELGITPTPEIMDALEAISPDELDKMMTLLKAGAAGGAMLAWP